MEQCSENPLKTIYLLKRISRYQMFHEQDLTFNEVKTKLEGDKNYCTSVVRVQHSTK